ncbi:NAD(P)-dependent oxidoreductase [Lactobacillus sp. ESL0701]|uniref:NAD(P)-dependent oxidoreductase n=1 Tax=Lactobacillus sp. ESL0701 TaxID=2983217 RepID=UPI0023F6E493|nr:NAD(P)-dependent oxidoreductase [Lactobacillus sp. ESL0701]MDF7672772.1 NAD(P)-dependent oxidoreductase [Lactobacillus sp. ESL0701]
MPQSKVLVTGKAPDQVIKKLQEVFDVTYPQNKQFSRAEVLQMLPEYDGVLLAGLKGDRELIDAGANLKIIATVGVGFDHIDIDYAQKKGIVVANTPQAVRMPTAEMAIALMLASVRRLHVYDQDLRAGNWPDLGEPRNMGMSLAGKTLGIYGMGRIGSTVGQFAQLLGMKVIYNNRHQLSSAEEQKLNVNYADFSTLIKNSDVITLHAPLTPQTEGVFNSSVFNEMKPTAYIINTARGKLINQADLITALENKTIAGAGLDVFAEEPEVPAALGALDNVVLTPHAGTATLEARTAIANEASENIIALLRDGHAKNMVNQVAQYL